MSLIIPANSASAAGGYAVDNSLRFNDGSEDSLTITPASASNRRTWTWSGWIKRGNLGITQIIFSGGSANTWIRFNDTDKLEFNIQDNDESTIITTQLFRDVSAWYHIVVAIDTTQGTDTNRIKFYVNGNQVTSFSTSVYVSQNYEAGINNTGAHYIGRLNYAATQWFDGYMAECVLIDGQQLDPTSFGEFDEDSGIWKPIDVSGLTFGTNGFYLDFEDSSALGDDTSGNGNDFTVNNLTAIDQTTDTPTNNFATYNPLINNSSGVPTMSNGNLTLVTNACEFGSVSSIGVSQGKWYCELKWDSGSYGHIGITGDPITLSVSGSPYAGSTADSWGWNYGGTIQNNGGTIATYSSFATSDILGIALDLTNNKLYFSKNGTWENSADPSAGSNGISITASNSVAEGNYFIFIGNGATAANATISANFGNAPYTISSGNTDGNGYGNFEYAVPSGYYSLNTKNLAEYG
jgi:hypothetical protein